MSAFCYQGLVHLAGLAAVEASGSGIDQYKEVKEYDLHLNVETCRKWYFTSDEIETAIVIGVVMIYCCHCDDRLLHLQ